MIKQGKCFLTSLLVVLLSFQSTVFAATSDQLFNNITSRSEYNQLVDRLDNYGTTREDVDNVISELSSSIVNKSYDSKEDLKNEVLIKSGIILLGNDEVKNAIKQAYSNEYQDWKNGNAEVPGVLDFAVDAAWNTLNGTAPPAGGGGGGGLLPAAEFLLKYSGVRAVVNANGKQYIQLTPEQIQAVKDNRKDLSLDFGDVKLLFSQTSLNITELSSQETAKLQIAAKVVPALEATRLVNASEYKQAGHIFDFSATVMDELGKVKSLSQFNGNVTIVLPVPEEFKQSAASGSLKAYYYNEGSQNWDLVGGSYDQSQNTITFMTSHFSKYALLESVAPPSVEVRSKFIDLKGHWAASDIEYMASKGYINGVGEGLFAPKAQVTRAEFAAMLVNVLGITEGASISFKDVSQNAWYYSSVARAFGAGLVKGTGQGTFSPANPITRQEMAAMICNALRYKGKSAVYDIKVLKDIADNQYISAWAKQAVAEAYTNGVVKGIHSSKGLTFAPLNKASRAEAAVMLKNFLDIN